MSSRIAPTSRRYQQPDHTDRVGNVFARTERCERARPHDPRPPGESGPPSEQSEHDAGRFGVEV